MVQIALVIENTTFCHALSDALAAFGSCKSVKTLEDCADFDILFAEGRFLNTPFPEKMPPLVFSIGDAGEASAITESFPLPLRLGHVQARLQIHLTAQKRTRELVFTLADATFNAKERLITRPSGQTARLTEKESLLLAHLLQLTESVSKEDLLATIWGYDATIDTRTLETHIYKLRSLALMQDVPGWKEMILVKKGFYSINPAWTSP